MTDTLDVRSKSHVYAVHVGCGLIEKAGTLIKTLSFAKAGGRCVLVTDENVSRLYADVAVDSLRRAGYKVGQITVPAGERSKSMQEAARICEQIAAHGLDRHGFLVALGGGVVGDLAGFAASIYYRGIPFVQIATTVVAQVDSAIGGKTGVNIAAGKNLLGTFHAPSLVLADVDTLATLPDRDFNEGMAEVIKHGIIRDRHLLQRLVHLRREDSAALAQIVLRNLEIKAAVVAADEFERTGERALLNFGHTIGHAIEQAAGYGHFLHGEAISLGIVAAARLSMRKVGLSASEYDEVVSVLRRFHLPVVLTADIPDTDILESLARDKKFEAGEIRFVLTPRLGQARVSRPGEIGWEDLRQEISRLRSA